MRKPNQATTIATDHRTAPLANCFLQEESLVDVAIRRTFKVEIDEVIEAERTKAITFKNFGSDKKNFLTRIKLAH